MSAADMAEICARCSRELGRTVYHFPDSRHYGRFRRLLVRLRLLRP